MISVTATTVIVEEFAGITFFVAAVEISNGEASIVKKIDTMPYCQTMRSKSGAMKKAKDFVSVLSQKDKDRMKHWL